MDSIFSRRGISQDELYEKADWKATMELRTMIESNTANGEICYWIGIKCSVEVANCFG